MTLPDKKRGRQESLSPARDRDSATPPQKRRSPSHARFGFTLTERLRAAVCAFLDPTIFDFDAGIDWGRDRDRDRDREREREHIRTSDAARGAPE
jgi:hypothetical protein